MDTVRFRGPHTDPGKGRSNYRARIFPPCPVDRWNARREKPGRIVWAQDTNHQGRVTPPKGYT